MAHRTALWARRSVCLLQHAQGEASMITRLAPVYADTQKRYKGKVKRLRDKFRKLKAPDRFHGPELSQEEKFIHSLGQSSFGRLGPAVVHHGEGALEVLGPVAPERNHKTRYVYMDDEEVDDYLDSVRRVFEQPIVDEVVPEVPQSRVIETDPAAANRRFNFVFVDVGKDQSNTEREIRIRQTDGVLRTANPEERDQYIAQFFATRYKRKAAPPLCHEPMLSHALAENQHRIILDMTVKTLLNYQADYRRIHNTVFEDIEQRRIYSVVQDTHHWVRFFQWLMKADQVDGLITMLLSAGRLNDAAKLCALRNTKAVPTSVSSSDLAALGEFLEGRVSSLNKALFVKAVKYTKSELS
eukprot:m.27016 g.27016  ORF g.27016 m.27016 type:complete len:355 (-) comp11740_c0_seq1:511-1575(-)